MKGGKQIIMDKIIYWTAKGHIGQNLTDNYNELGCVASLNNIVRYAIGQSITDSPSTIQLNKSILLDKRFEQVFEPQIGDIILSPTIGQSIGHCGILSDIITDSLLDTDFLIMSNNSKTFLFDEHLKLSEWRKKFKHLEIKFFRYRDPNNDVIIEQKKISLLLKIIELYKQLLAQLSIKKLGNMNNSKLFRINYKDVLKGLMVACLSAVFLKLATALNVPGFSFSSYDWAGLLQVAIASGVGYISKQFFSDSQGTPLGKADR